MADQSLGEVEDFCRRVHPKLAGALALHCGDASLAEEVAQEALARAWERWGSVSGMERPDAWVFRVGFNILTCQLRRRGAERRAVSRQRAQRAPNLPDSDEALLVRRAVGDLPTRQRTAVVLRFFADLSVDATATAMSCRPGTVKSLTHDAVVHLRDSLDAVFNEDQELAFDA